MCTRVKSHSRSVITGVKIMKKYITKFMCKNLFSLGNHIFFGVNFGGSCHFTRCTRKVGPKLSCACTENVSSKNALWQQNLCTNLHPENFRNVKILWRSYRTKPILTPKNCWFSGHPKMHKNTTRFTKIDHFLMKNFYWRFSCFTIRYRFQLA